MHIDGSFLHDRLLVCKHIDQFGAIKGTSRFPEEALQEPKLGASEGQHSPFNRGLPALLINPHPQVLDRVWGTSHSCSLTVVEMAFRLLRPTITDVRPGGTRQVSLHLGAWREA
jgi:hypothetical protein